jgi:hypothetical protein
MICEDNKLVQIVFNSKQQPEDYVNKNGCGEYPEAPSRCPHKDCGVAMEMSKNGFYLRYLITCIFAGKIRIRRYKCRKCGHTVSMLPSFCLPQYTYGLELIIEIMLTAATSSIRKAANKFNNIASSITRRQVAKYLVRLRQNKNAILYGQKQISPGDTDICGPPGDIEWTRNFLCGTRPQLSTEFNAEFHKAMGRSFMSTQYKIA